MHKLLEQKVSVVTGGTRGIGFAIAEAFNSEGSFVYATGRRKPEDYEAWIERFPFPEAVAFLQFDVTDSNAVKERLLGIKRTHGAIDILANNAGVEHNELLGMSSEHHMHEMFETNVYGTILMTQYASRIMRARKSGSIINISSGVGIKGNPGQSVYSATKGAVNAFTKSAAKELARDGIRVNAVAPGLTQTQMASEVREDALTLRLSRIPLGRFAQPEEIADACVFLASDKASYISGQIIAVDGCAVM